MHTVKTNSMIRVENKYVKPVGGYKNFNFTLKIYLKVF